MYTRRKGFSDYGVIFTQKSDAVWLFFVFSPVMEVSQMKGARVSFELLNLSGSLVVEVGYQLSDDAETWPASTSSTGIGATRNAEGTTWTTTWTDMTSLDKKLR